jgi:hypothetical protein
MAERRSRSTQASPLRMPVMAGTRQRCAKRLSLVDFRKPRSCFACQVFSSFFAAPRVLGGSATSTGFLGRRPHLTASLQALCRQVRTWRKLCAFYVRRDVAHDVLLIGAAGGRADRPRLPFWRHPVRVSMLPMQLLEASPARQKSRETTSRLTRQ